MNELQVFNDSRFGEVRFVEIDGKPHAIGKDVAESLDYKYPADAIRNNCKGSKDHRTPTKGGKQLMKAIPEPDVYRLIVKAASQSQSKRVRKKAEEFEEWIFEEVLPELRRKGSYKMEEQPDDDLAVAENLNKQVTHIISHMREQEEEINNIKDNMQQLENKVDVAKEHDDVTASEIARRLGITTVNGTAHNQLIGAIAKKLGMKNDYKHRYQDEEVKILPRAEGGYQVYYRPGAAQKIYDWFNEHKNAIYYEKYYQRGGKYGNKGDLKEKGYTVRGTNYKIWSAKESKEAV